MSTPNTQECIYFGRKMSNICCDHIDVSVGYIGIGSDNDDEIYFDIVKKDGIEHYVENERTLKERVKITVIHDGTETLDYADGFVTEIDMEAILKFAAENCRGIYERVMEDSE